MLPQSSQPSGKRWLCVTDRLWRQGVWHPLESSQLIVVFSPLSGTVGEMPTLAVRRGTASLQHAMAQDLPSMPLVFFDKRWMVIVVFTIFILWPQAHNFATSCDMANVNRTSGQMPSNLWDNKKMMGEFCSHRWSILLFCQTNIFFWQRASYNNEDELLREFFLKGRLACRWSKQD